MMWTNQQTTIRQFEDKIKLLIVRLEKIEKLNKELEKRIENLEKGKIIDSRYPNNQIISCASFTAPEVIDKRY